MKTRKAAVDYRYSCLLVGLACIGLSFSAVGATTSQGSVIVRVDDPSGTHCIDSTKEQVTIFLRRAFVERKSGIFTEDNKAGVLVRTSVTGSGTDDNSDVKVPAVDMVSVKDDASGRVSLALEYPVASNLVLKQGTTQTQSMSLLVNLAKTKGKNSFGQVLDIAGQVLGQSLLPSNPYTAGASKFLKFANQTIDASISADNDEEIARFGLQFNAGDQPDIKKCESAGNERTGALVALRDVGKPHMPLIPVTDTQKQYCFSYSSQNTYELTAAHRKDDGTCPDAAQFAGVNNDYVMLLLSASPASAHLGPDRPPKESVDRCKNFNLPKAACGLR